MVIGIIGLGLMGASFGRTARKNGAKVYGFDLDGDVIKEAQLIGAIDDELSAVNARESDLLVFAAYQKDFSSSVKRFLPLLKNGATVMDFCGNKRTIARDMKKLSEEFPEINFVGGHPMAGREVSGINNSLPDLFAGASMVLAPIKADIGLLEEIKKYYLSLGFKEVVITTPENHDKNIAFTSQLCHIVSNAYIKSPTAENHFGYSAGSYKDLTRVARLSPEMWTDLMTANADNLSKELDCLIENLKKYSAALKNNDEKYLKELLAEGNDRKIKIDKGKIE
ncbi:MAG: prephenate dehydrogenase [Clostridia bacterium]|nr:prephenate dehydrogenase [Clostridia bacterium]